ncbi:mechanosensitive ion channel [Sulfurospirillum sp. T05]|uniref:Mechanosensitive ion channel n=2 Tax=Sulfurospirillum tamanense TaxID=2813362 RepID=A0ABS2WNJ1_9BACT|nr:mechanosensitive ion channel [Sulfurospirillum tamanensis]
MMEWESIATLAGAYGLKVLGSLFIFFVGKKLASLASSLANKMMEKAKVEITLAKFFSNVIYGLLLVVIVLAALSNIGIETTSFVAVLGAAGLAVGLAFKDTFSNVGAGVLLVVFRPFKVDDFINAAGESGTVEEINLFSTFMRTADNKLIIVPNGRIIGGNIVNFSAKPTRRVDLKFGVSYGDDLRLVKQALREVLEADERILKEPEPFVAVSELADSSVNFVVRAWVNSPDYWGVYFDTTERVKLAFDEKGITIPFPQVQLHKE